VAVARGTAHARHGWPKRNAGLILPFSLQRLWQTGESAEATRNKSTKDVDLNQGNERLSRLPRRLSKVDLRITTNVTYAYQDGKRVAGEVAGGCIDMAEPRTGIILGGQVSG